MKISDDEAKKLLACIKRLVYSRDHLTKEDREAVKIIDKLLEDNKGD